MSDTEQRSLLRKREQMVTLQPGTLTKERPNTVSNNAPDAADETTEIHVPTDPAAVTSPTVPTDGGQVFPPFLAPTEDYRHSQVMGKLSDMLTVLVDIRDLLSGQPTTDEG